MKKSYFCLVALTLLMSSCYQEDNESVILPKEQSLKIVNVVEGKIVPSNTKSAVGDFDTMSLQFASETDLQEVLNKFVNMSADEKIAFTDALGFVSLEKLYQIADAELDSIGASAVSETDFRKKYAEYKEKYSGIFVFNNQQSDDLSPYIPASSEDDGFAYLLGVNHSVVIGNSIRKVGFSNMMREEDDLLYNEESSNVVTRAEAIPVNGFKVISGSKKTTFSASVKYGELASPGSPKWYKLYFHFGAQKKMWYGWKRDTARDFILTSRNFEQHLFRNAKGDYDVYSLEYGSETTKFNELVYVWTDMTVNRDDKGNILMLGNKVSCDINKAYKCQINISYK